jgi:hypothetical protein
VREVRKKLVYVRDDRSPANSALLDLAPLAVDWAQEFVRALFTASPNGEFLTD